MALITNANVALAGVFVSLIGDTVTVPFIQIEASAKSSTDAVQPNSFQSMAVGRLNNRLPDKLDVIGVIPTATTSIANIKIDLSQAHAHAGDDADSQEVYDFLKEQLTVCAEAGKVDEGDRLSFVPQDVNYNMTLHVVGSIDFDDDGVAVMTPSSVVMGNGKVLNLA